MLPATTPFHRLSVEDVHRMVDAGVLREDERVELIDGVLVDVIPPAAQHSSAVAWLTRHLAALSGEQELRVQDLLLIEGGFVMPDLMVTQRVPRDRHPSSAALVIEVAVTTHRHDAWKAERYARAQVDEYWIVDLPGRALTAHRRPGADGYSEITRHGDGELVSTDVGVPGVEVSELLGPTG